MGKALIIDITKCNGCYNCQIACKDEHVGNDWTPYAKPQPDTGQFWMKVTDMVRGTVPKVKVAYMHDICQHCDDAPCITACKQKAIYKREDGIVIIDPEKAGGQEDILKACPYDAIWWNEEKNIPQKCTFCAHLLDDGWDNPRCVQACPTGALRAIKEEDANMKMVVNTEDLEVLAPEYNTLPRVFYRNLYRYTHCFIGGSVAHEEQGTMDCSEWATVTLFKNSEKVDETLTNNFGDFRFDGLEENSGKYTMEILLKDYKKKTIEVELKASINIGNILLED